MAEKSEDCRKVSQVSQVSHKKCEETNGQGEKIVQMRHLKEASKDL